VHIPVKADGSSKGFAHILFNDPEAAVAAFQSVGTGATFQGRLVHVLPGSARRDEALDEFQLSQLPLAKQRMIRKKQEATKNFNWNSLFMSQDAVNTAVADRLGVSKADLLDVHDSSAAVKQAVAETSVIQETKEYFAAHGVDLDAFKSQKKSDDIILVKNIPVTTHEELRARFEEHGTVLQVLMPPSKTVAIVQFAQAAQGKTAFAREAYRKFKDSIFYLEKAPVGLFKNAIAEPAKTSTGDRPAGVQKLSGTDLFDKDEEDQGEATSVFVKNLNFETTKASLDEVAKSLEGYRGSTVKTKPDPKKPGQTLSMGFGFIAFNSREAANAAVAALNGYVLDKHTLQAKLSSKGYDAAEERRREDKAKKGSGQRSKLIVKNLGFEVSKKVRRIRHPPPRHLSSSSWADDHVAGPAGPLLQLRTAEELPHSSGHGRQVSRLRLRGLQDQPRGGECLQRAKGHSPARQEAGRRLGRGRAGGPRGADQGHGGKGPRADGQGHPRGAHEPEPQEGADWRGGGRTVRRLSGRRLGKCSWMRPLRASAAITTITTRRYPGLTTRMVEIELPSTKARRGFVWLSLRNLQRSRQLIFLVHRETQPHHLFPFHATES
jgi:RNA recognition motif-containing protein